MTSRIYKLYNPESGHYYFGSTKNSLDKRIIEHKALAKTNPNRPLYKVINELGWDMFIIEQISSFSDLNNLEVRQIENMYISKSLEDPLCLNKNRAFITEEERKISNRMYCKRYRDANKRKLQEEKAILEEAKNRYESLYLEAHKSNRYLDCPCGGKYLPELMRPHSFSIKHLQYEAFIDAINT